MTPNGSGFLWGREAGSPGGGGGGSGQSRRCKCEIALAGPAVGKHGGKGGRPCGLLYSGGQEEDDEVLEDSRVEVHGGQLDSDPARGRGVKPDTGQTGMVCRVNRGPQTEPPEHQPL